MPGQLPQWVKVTFAVPLGSQEAVAELLWELDTAGFEEKESGRELRIEAYFSAGTDPAHLMQDLERRASQAGLALMRLQADSYQEDPEDWIRNWRSNYRSFTVGKTFSIHPPWEAPDPACPVHLVLEPSRAFGTGTHESTQLCLLALERLAPGCRSLLDAGTGSGILSVAALKLNPALRAFALDNDPDAVEVALQTRQRHGLSAGKMELICGELPALSGRFDLVVANLTLAIIRQNAQDLIRVAGQRLLLSGLTSDQQDQALELFLGKSALRLEEQQEMNGWASLLLSCWG